MTPEEKCVSLETAKRLKEAGFPQNTQYFLWLLRDDRTGRWGTRLFTNKRIDSADCFAAPDVSELLEVLPKEKWEKHNGENECFDLCILHQNGKFVVGYKTAKDCWKPLASFSLNSLPEALAFLWLNHQNNKH